MRSLICVTICILIAGVLKAQTISYKSAKPFVLKASTTIGTKKVAAGDKLTLPFTVETKGQTLTITTKADDNESTALNTDYAYDAGSIGNITLDHAQDDKSGGTFNVVIKNITASKKTNAVFEIEMKNNKDYDKTFKVTVNFNSDDNIASTTNNTGKNFSPDTTHWYLRVVTGGNFDFFNGATIKDFAGDITAFAPNMFKIHAFGQDIKAGIEFGLNHYHYFDSDSSHNGTDNKAYFLNYKDFYSPTDDSKVVKTSQNINKKFDYSVWGVHIDPMFTLSENEFAQVYLKFHIEELATTETYTPSVKSSVSDTIINGQYTTYIRQNPLNGYPTTPTAHIRPLISYSQHTYYDLYLGIGFPFAINIKNIATLCISPSCGIASLELSQNAFDSIAPIRRDIVSNGAMHEGKFYTLNKFQLVTSVAPINIAIGGEYRTIASNMHYFASYIGAAVTLDKLKH